MSESVVTCETTKTRVIRQNDGTNVHDDEQFTICPDSHDRVAHDIGFPDLDPLDEPIGADTDSTELDGDAELLRLAFSPLGAGFGTEDYDDPDRRVHWMMFISALVAMVLFVVLFLGWHALDVSHDQERQITTRDRIAACKDVTSEAGRLLCIDGVRGDK